MKKIAFLASLILIPAPVFGYTVQPGDTLSSIAQKYNTTWQELWENNSQIENPNVIYVGDEIQTDEQLGLALPSDNYDSFLSSPLSSSTSTVYVNAIPTGVTETIYTLYASDGVTPREKIYCTSTGSSPYRLLNCVRGISFSPVSGTITETAGTGLPHSKNTRIAITDNINFSGKALAILSGNQKTSSTDFIIGTNVSTTINLFFANTSATSTAARVLFRGGNLGWTDDGVSFYRFVDGGSGLSASSTKGIGITDSKIHINASSTGGLEFNSADGYIQVKASSTKGIATDSNGTYLDTSDSMTWTGQQTFNATSIFTTSTMASTTISDTLNLRGSDTRTLVPTSGGLSSSSSLHFHTSNNLTYSTTTATNAPLDVVLAHGLPAAPKKIRLSLTSTYTSTNPKNLLSTGVWDDLNGTGATSTFQRGIRTIQDNGSGGAGLTTWDTSVLTTSIGQFTSIGSDKFIKVQSVDATNITLRFDANGGGNSAVSIVIEAEL